MNIYAPVSKLILGVKGIGPSGDGVPAFGLTYNGTALTYNLQYLTYGT